MKRITCFLVATALAFTGCGPTVTDVDPADGDTLVVELPSETVELANDGVFELTAENTKIEFVGTHIADDPNPRTGGFKTFSGKAEYNPATNELVAVSVEIQTDSLWTNAGDRLDGHLKNEDFFDVRQYPTATFNSTDVTKSGDHYDITGDFTLHGTTKELSFPAKANVVDGIVTLSGEFTFDRTEWGMDRLTDRVHKDVSLTVVIGEKTEPRLAEGGGGGGGRRGGGGGRGNWDPAERFKQQDANGDGKLVGDEINEFLMGRMDTLDSNGDGELTLEEFQEGMRQVFSAGGRGGRGGRGGGEERPDRPARPATDDE